MSVSDAEEAGGCCCCFPKRVRLEKKKQPPKNGVYLYTFDFDHTIVDANSEVAVMSIIKNPIPDDLRHTYNGTNWNEYMEKVMYFVAEEGGTIPMLVDRLREIALAPGMEQLLQKVCVARLEKPGSKLLIISDANDLFIDVRLKHMTPPVIPDLIVANRATGTCVVQDKEHEKLIKYLKLEAYETQTHCNLCPQNLCKGSALTRFVEKEGPFETVYYTGDGVNDVCAAIALTEKDILFVRRGFTLEKVILAGKVRNIEFKIRARIVYYTDASEIIENMNF